MKVGVYTQHTSKGVKQRGLVRKIFKMIEKHELDVFLGAEYLFMPDDKFYKERKKDKFVKRFMRKSEGLDTLIVPGTMTWYDETYFYNTAFAFSDGKLLSSYDKFLDVDTADNAVLKKCHKRRKVIDIPRKEDFGVFYWNDLFCGMEICSDGANHKLENFLARNSAPLLDMYLFPSCGLTLGPYYCSYVIDGGYAFGADGYRASARAYHMNPEFLEGIEEIYSKESFFDPESFVWDTEFMINRRDSAFLVYDL